MSRTTLPGIEDDSLVEALGLLLPGTLQRLGDRPRAVIDVDRHLEFKMAALDDSFGLLA